MLDFYKLNEKPFSLLPNPRFLYLSDQYLETKSKLLYFLQDRSASLYLYGEVGYGKTSLLRLIAQEISDMPDTLARYVITPNLKTANQILRRICAEFKVKTERSYEGSLRNFESFLIGRAKENKFPLLMLDEAQNITQDGLKLIHYLLNFVSDERVLLMIVLVGQPELAGRINRFPSLKSRLISASLTALTRQDMEQMIMFRWHTAASNKECRPPFTPDAYDLIYQITKGNPRLVCKLCNNTLLHGFTKNTRTIAANLIQMAAKEL